MLKIDEKISCLVCGAGGIGSYLSAHLDKLIELKQLTKSKFTFFDDDKVEIKNMLYQNFRERDIDDYKTEALASRYFNLNFVTKRIDLAHLKEFNLVVLCADNNIIRRQAWTNWENNKIPFIDSRANGRAIGIFSNETPNYLNTISASNDSSSCQNPFQLAKKEIEYGNVVIAAYLAQCLLNFERKAILPNDFMVMI